MKAVQVYQKSMTEQNCEEIRFKQIGGLTVFQTSTPYIDKKINHFTFPQSTQTIIIISEASDYTSKCILHDNSTILNANNVKQYVKLC